MLFLVVFITGEEFLLLCVEQPHHVTLQINTLTSQRNLPVITKLPMPKCSITI